MNVDALLHRLRLAPARNNARAVMILCVYHTERTASLRLWRGSLRFYCHGCQRIGDLADIVAHLTGQERGEGPVWERLEALVPSLPMDVPPEQLRLPF